MWQYVGKVRPAFAIEPGEGQESVWDYPRPPRIENDSRLIRVAAGDAVVAQSSRCIRILETAGAPTFYLPPDDVRMKLLVPGRGQSFCEWKGTARYWSLCAADVRIDNVGWSYPTPTPAFERIRDYVSFYPSKLDCLVDDERVCPQPGGFYGGWVTKEIVGPIKGEPGSESW